jgi:hypothetical protein
MILHTAIARFLTTNLLHQREGNCALCTTFLLKVFHNSCGFDQNNFGPFQLNDATSLTKSDFENTNAKQKPLHFLLLRSKVAFGPNQNQKYFAPPPNAFALLKIILVSTKSYWFSQNDFIFYALRLEETLQS